MNLQLPHLLLLVGGKINVFVSYPLRFARPPTLGGQPLRSVKQAKCMIFSVPTTRMVLNKGFPVFGHSAWR